MEELTEKDAKMKFLNIVPYDYFIVHKEVRGNACYVKKLKRMFAGWKNEKHQKTVRIDFILEPTEQLLRRGWELGCVGVEIKSSFKIQKKEGEEPGKEVGKAICQILDYQSCEYKLKTQQTQQTELSMIFLYPHIKTYHITSSIMMQEGLGFVRSLGDYNKAFQLVQANHNEPVFTLLTNGEVEIKRPRFGKKFGNRS